MDDDAIIKAAAKIQARRDYIEKLNVMDRKSAQLIIWDDMGNEHSRLSIDPISMGVLKASLLAQYDLAMEVKGG
jgi:hypothetical protein